MAMRQLISIHGQDAGPHCWKCTQCDQLFWTSNDPAHRTPPARVWAHFQQHSCETFTVISRWLTDAIKPGPCDSAVDLAEKQPSSDILGRAGKLARWFARSLTPPNGIPAGYSIVGNKDDESKKSKTAPSTTS